MKVLIIGAGAAGMMAAIAAADHGAQVILLEKNEKLGKKIYITGKGRCNITNGCPTEDFFDNVVSNPKFLYSAVYTFDQSSMCSFLENEGLKLKEERGQRIFPESDKSSDVIKTLEHALRRRNVQIRLNTCVDRVVTDESGFSKVITSKGENIKADALIIATGGLSYKSTGSTGDGYRFASKMGHKIIDTEPSLVPLRVKEGYVKDLEGLSLKNVNLTIGRFSDFGEMLFTSDGISGPLVLTASSDLCRQIAGTQEGISAYIDLKPALTPEQLDQRILRDFAEEKNKAFKNSLNKLLPSKLIPVMVDLSQIREDKKVNEITKEERKRLAELIKKFPLTIVGNKGFEQAVITQGGISVREIDASTMESKIVENVYFAGEVMDVDAYTGGFNLQIAWSTGYLAGMSACKKENR